MSADFCPRDLTFQAKLINGRFRDSQPSRYFIRFENLILKCLIEIPFSGKGQKAHFPSYFLLS